MLKLYHAVASKDIENYTLEGSSVQDWLSAVELYFVDPLTNEELTKLGAETVVTTDNLERYVNFILRRWTHEGIQSQVEAFRQGLTEVISGTSLHLFSPDELLNIVQGSQDLDWTTTTLRQSMRPGHGYTEKSQPYLDLVDALVDMDIDNRRAFLLFATGCPCLPPGGIGQLKPKFEISRRIVNLVNVDEALPFARTCTNTLHLPPYTNAQTLRQQLKYAMINSEGVIDRD